MSSALAAMDAALYSALNVPDVTTGAGKATGGVHRFRVPQGVSLPAVVFGHMSGEDSYVLGGGRAYIRLTYQIKAVFEGLSGSTASALADTIDSLVTNVAISVSGFTLMVGRRVRLIGYIEDGEGGVTYQHVGGEYEFMLDPA